MQIDLEQNYLLKAMNAFQKKLIIISPEFDILTANRFALGRFAENSLGKKCHAVIYNRLSACENCPAQRVIQTHNHALRNIQDNTLEMDRVPCLYAYPIIKNNKLEAITVMDFEISSAEVKDKLQRTNAFLKNLLHSAVDAVIAADTTGKIILFNNAAAEVSGYSVEEALTSLNIREFYSGDRALEVMRKLRSGEYGGIGKLKEYPVDFMSKQGDKIPISLYASIIYENDKEVATIGFFRDLRKRIQIQKELAKTQVQLMQSEKMAGIGKLAAGVAHQLNNPLGGIILYSKLIMEEYDLEEALKDDMDRILKDAQRCRDTVKELLEFARQTHHFIKSSDINQAISRTLFLLENQTLFQNIKIKKNLEPSLPLVETDIHQMNHVFMNLILNAAQAMDGQGEINIRTDLSLRENYIVIEISDTGPGIAEEVLQHIFEPFFTTKEEGQGTGLGLSMVYSIVENHGGSIYARNRKTKGAAFTIEIPIKNKGSKGAINEA
ncbi:MAG: PAS domain S-box protein [Deltaproteobacteria bacterium]|nr:PAS domain S-box protein [Deltaproteobacteria bacterium]